MRPLDGVLADSGVYQQPGSGLTIIGSRLLCVNRPGKGIGLRQKLAVNPEK